MLQDCLANTYDFILKTNPRPLGPHQQEEVYEIYTSPMKAMLFNVVVAVQLLSCVWLFATPRTVACQVPLSMGFLRQDYCNALPFPSSGDLPNPGFKPMSPALADGFFTIDPPGKPFIIYPGLIHVG